MTSNEAVEALLHSCSWKWGVRDLFQDVYYRNSSGTMGEGGGEK
jgi:hypothetical protein